MDLKAGPFSGSAAAGDPAIVNLDNPMNHGQSEPRSFARSLGAEERLEDLLQSSFVHAVAGIRDAEQDSFT
jgi:hypothetical protein